MDGREEQEGKRGEKDTNRLLRDDAAGWGRCVHGFGFGGLGGDLLSNRGRHLDSVLVQEMSECIRSFVGVYVVWWKR